MGLKLAAGRDWSNAQGSWVRGTIYAGGRPVATYVNNTTYFSTGNWLGTERASTGANGAVTETCQGLPFGDGLSCLGYDASPLHFTGKERDAESGLDYFGARYDSSTVGRFLTPDWSAAPEAVPYANLADPQSLNLYAYVMNNPVTAFDVDGHHCGATGPTLERLPTFLRCTSTRRSTSALRPNCHYAPARAKLPLC